jgi:S1-C subfamily serine protease
MKKEMIKLVMVCAIIGLFLVFNIYGEPPKTAPTTSNQPTKTTAPSPADNQPLTRGTFIQLSQRVTPAVVNVFNMTESGAFGTNFKAAGGTGFIIDSKKGILLTNHHVISGAKSLKITLNDKRSFKTKLLGSDPIYDVAVLQIENPPANLQQVALGNSDKVTVGEWIMAIGQPLFMEYTVTSGIVCSLGQEVITSRKQYESIEYRKTHILIDAILDHGNSGGPLFNLNGEVIGINTVGKSRYGGAIPINLALSIKDKILKDGRVIRAYLGLIGKDFDDDLTYMYNTTIEDLLKDLGLKDTKGLFIQGATDDSPAKAAGFVEADVLTEMAGVKIENIKAFRAVMEKLKPGDVVTLKFIRKSKEESVNVTMAEMGGGQPANPHENDDE